MRLQAPPESRLTPGANICSFPSPRAAEKFHKVYPVIWHTHFASSFPFQFGVSRSHIAAMEQVEDRPVPRFGKPHFVGGLLDGLAIADGGAGFIKYYPEIPLLRLQRLRPRQVAASKDRHAVIRRTRR